ncbi:uncharacterized protein LOC111014843 isoform X2 [Momordica charantia]|uniref:Uncharacterized protein LOC111014843 isoform X2 n=1 Tax=Momordica charantia TaxID=3673 RepID=A0A6J1CW57_MOMCH|nr:uncharacterized protein LOC111014843 isoform X2 [Momordica charantia]
MAFFSLRSNYNGFLHRLNDLIKLQSLRHGFANGGVFRSPMNPEMDFHSAGRRDEAANIGMSKWNKVDARAFGIKRSMIPPSSWMVLQILQKKGFETYLVGGCVRDLILNRVPKDFDVITTAGLQQIRKLFHRAQIVGRRFPICMVNIKGSVIEVSSFETVAKHSEGKGTVVSSQIPRKCVKEDLIRWRNSMHRDFTINSLFFDPFRNMIYDYAEGITDLRSLKFPPFCWMAWTQLRTLIPASLSFKEDCARILRGLRIAARLGLSLSKDTETAIRKLSPSIMSLDKTRIMMELNYMLSYGAAVPSLYLLQRFNLLQILLPFHAAYLDKQDIKESSLNSIMLMKLFSNLDKLVSCDRPSDCNIWVGLLAFHMALVKNPQNSLIVLAFAGTLYHGDWNEGVNYARENSLVQINLRPEITRSAQFKSKEELAEGVSHFASKVQGCIAAFTGADCLFEATPTLPTSPCSNLVFVSKKTAKDVAKIFEVLVNDVESFKNKRENFEIDYQLLGKGILSESRYVMGKIIFETLNGAIVQGDENILDKKQNLCVDTTTKENYNSPVSDIVKDQLVVMKEMKVKKLPSTSEVRLGANKKRKLVQKEGRQTEHKCEDLEIMGMMDEVIGQEEKSEKRERKIKKSPPSSEGKLRANKKHKLVKKEGREENNQTDLETAGNQVKDMILPQEAHDKVTKELLHAVDVNPRNMNGVEVIGQEGKSEKKERYLLSQGKENTNKKHRHVTGTAQPKGPLSSLFK